MKAYNWKGDATAKLKNARPDYTRWNRAANTVMINGQNSVVAFLHRSLVEVGQAQ